MHNSLIAGFSVSSEIPLPGVIHGGTRDAGSDITIRLGKVPTDLENALLRGPLWAMQNECFLLRVPRIARFLLRGGNEIVFEPEPGAGDHEIAVFALGSAFGILMHQRRLPVLHASAVADNGRALVICGNSGAGKSTLAAAMCRAGCSMVADDVCVIRNGDGQPAAVYPDGRKLKLWRDAIHELDLNAQCESAVRASIEKYFVQSPHVFSDSLPLRAIYILHEENPPLRGGIEKLALPDAMRALESGMWRRELFAAMGQAKEMFPQMAAVVGHTGVFRLVRPWGFAHLAETAAMLRTHTASLDNE